MTNLFKAVERIKDHIYRSNYVCTEMSEEIFTKILTVVIFGWQIYEYLFSLCLSGFSNFHKLVLLI